MTVPRILVTGADGQLGRSLKALSASLNAEWIWTTRHDCDLADPETTAAYFAQNTFDYCIHTAAYTKVDLAEQEGDLARMINEEALRTIARYCALQKSILIHFSTDYVYDNGLTRPLREDDPVTPKSVYAHTKLGGERHALEQNPQTLILRTSWVFSEYGHNFVRTMVRLMREGRPLRVVDDQIGCPTYAGDLARAVIAIIGQLERRKENRPFGIYNYCNQGETTWYRFAQVIAQMLGVEADLTPVTTAEYQSPAVRPAYSVLDTTKIKATFGVETPHWREGLGKVLRGV